jgi:hypothetical protein
MGVARVMAAQPESGNNERAGQKPHALPFIFVRNPNFCGLAPDAIQGSAYSRPMSLDLKLIMGKAGPGSAFLMGAPSSCPKSSQPTFS